MKRIITSILALLLIFTVVISAVACGGNDSKSALEMLSADEKYVYDTITGKLSTFHDPSSVTIKTIYQHTDSSVMIEISAKNGFGNLVSEDYLLFTKDASLPSGTKIASKGHFESFSDMNTRLGKSLSGSDMNELFTFMTKTSPTVNISYSEALLNEAINDYKALRGWD